jgi:hypothetical protein
MVRGMAGAAGTKEADGATGRTELARYPDAARGRKGGIQGHPEGEAVCVTQRGVLAQSVG